MCAAKLKTARASALRKCVVMIRTGYNVNSKYLPPQLAESQFRDSYRENPDIRGRRSRMLSTKHWRCTQRIEEASGGQAGSINYTLYLRSQCMANEKDEYTAHSLATKIEGFTQSETYR